jgi:hypothetical protein
MGRHDAETRQDSCPTRRFLGEAACASRCIPGALEGPGSHRGGPRPGSAAAEWDGRRAYPTPDGVAPRARPCCGAFFLFLRRARRSAAHAQAVLDILDELGVPAAPRVISEIAVSNYGRPLPASRFASLRRDEERACRKDPLSRPTWVVPTFTPPRTGRLPADRGELCLAPRAASDRWKGAQGELSPHSAGLVFDA